MERITILDGQSLLDLALQQAGSIEAVFDLALANGLSVTDDLAEGGLVDAVMVVNKPIANYYANNRLTPATALAVDSRQVALEGIGYWAINVDFIIE